MTIVGTIAYALFVFWVCGTCAVFVDIDHIWTILGKRPPFKLSESFGRPLHTRTVFTFVAVISGLVIATLGNGFYKSVLLGFGEAGAVVLFLTLIFITYGMFRYLSKRLQRRMLIIRRTWRKQNKESIK